MYALNLDVGIPAPPLQKYHIGISEPVIRQDSQFETVFLCQLGNRPFPGSTALLGMPRAPAPPQRYIDRLRIREAREALGLQQSDIAKELDIHPNNVSRWETGERHLRAWQLVMLAEAMKVPPAFLIEDGDGLVQEERDLIHYLRDHPQDAHILLTTFRAMRDARTSKTAD